MSKISVLDVKGNKVSDAELNDAIWGIEPNVPVMHAVVVNYLANQRQGTQSTLTRTEVSGGGRKPWRQKGTGHARQGSTRSPQWTHGGVALGPKPRSYRYTVNKKVRRLAMKSALSSKLLGDDVIVIDNIGFDSVKTKNVAEMLKAVGAEGKALIVKSLFEDADGYTVEKADTVLVKSARNIPGVKTSTVNNLNVYDVLNSDKLIVSQDAVAKIEEVYC